ncbi:MAG: polysaccharide deacetylase family protein [Gaiellaceae bacterium]
MPVRPFLRRIIPLVLRRKTVLSLTFDDGTADHLPVVRLLAERGIGATFYLNSNRVGSDPGLASVAAESHLSGCKRQTSERVRVRSL